MRAGVRPWVRGCGRAGGQTGVFVDRESLARLLSYGRRVASLSVVLQQSGGELPRGMEVSRGEGSVLMFFWFIQGTGSGRVGFDSHSRKSCREVESGRKSCPIPSILYFSAKTRISGCGKCVYCSC